MFVKSLSAAGGPVERAFDMPAADSIADSLLRHAGLRCAARSAPAFAQAPVMVEECVVGRVAIVDPAHAEWSPAELRALGDAAAAVSRHIKVPMTTIELTPDEVFDGRPGAAAGSTPTEGS